MPPPGSAKAEPKQTEADKSLEWATAVLAAHIGSGFYGKFIFDFNDGAIKRIIKEESMRAPYIEQTYRGVLEPK